MGQPADFPNADIIDLTICDAIFDWTKIDIITFSWQKALGGEMAC